MRLAANTTINILPNAGPAKWQRYDRTAPLSAGIAMNRPAAPIGSDDRTPATRDGVMGPQSLPHQGPSGTGPEASAGETVVTVEWLRQQIERLERRLERQIERGRADDDYVGIPKSGRIRIVVDPVTFRRRTFREVFEADLAVMREALRQLVAGAAQAGDAHARKQARAWTGKFDKDLAALLDEAAKTGHLDLDGMHEIRAISDEAIRAWTEAARAKPTPQNVRGLLNQVAHSQLAGLDDAGAGPIAQAWAVLQDAGTGLARAAEQRFRASPSADNMLRFARAAGQAQLLGAEGAIGDDPDHLPRGPVLRIPG
jgi:hypothetical protein